MNRFIFVIDDSIINLHLLDDLESNYEIHIAKKKYFLKTKNRFLNKILNSSKFNRMINYVTREKNYDISNLKFNSLDNNYLIVFNGAFWTYDYYVFNSIKKKYNVKLIGLYIDSLDVKTNTGKLLKRNLKKVNWDSLYTFSYGDSIKYNLKYLDEHYYSNVSKYVKNVKEKSDIYFIGRYKPGRYEIINKIYDYLTDNGVKCDFNIYLNNREARKYRKHLKPGINYYYKSKDYLETLNDLNSSKCVLEILTDGQNAQTLRYFEAVLLNKKLLTNNINITNLKFFDDRYMKIFKSVEDIDIKWLKKQIDVNYHYKNEFSIKLFVEDVINNINK